MVGEWRFSLIHCDILLTLDVMMCTASILNLCAISIDRYSFSISIPSLYLSNYSIYLEYLSYYSISLSPVSIALSTMSVCLAVSLALLPSLSSHTVFKIWIDFIMPLQQKTYFKVMVMSPNGKCLFLWFAIVVFP